MLSKIFSCTLVGIDAYVVDVEVDVSAGLPSFSIVGLPDTAVQEARERVRSAIRNSGYEFPVKRITVNLAPADIKKEGSSFDLPIALGILCATEQLVNDRMDSYMFTGELSLDGTLRRVNGVLPMALQCKQSSMNVFVVPKANGSEAVLVKEIKVYAFDKLSEVVEFLNGNLNAEPCKENSPLLLSESIFKEDFAEVKGQNHAKRALEIAAAGGHNVIMVGPPGSGKTMLAERMPGILPPLTWDEAIDITKLFSCAGLLKENISLVTVRPFRSPHHSISHAGLVGGGTYPRPGEISLSHHGVLFLDEFAEFHRDVLEVLRQPLEEGSVTISRAAATLTFPASFMLIAAMNPCPCGFFSDPVKTCTCTPLQIQRYLKKISGPLLDRIDIHVEVPRLEIEKLISRETGESSKNIRERVTHARKRQIERLKNDGVYTNARMKTRHLKKYCLLNEDSRALLKSCIESLGLSARAYDKILKVSRTIADIEGSEEIQIHHVAEAAQYRSVDRKLWN